jgi:hypothetical protein
MDQLRLFKLKHDLVKISLDLHTAFAADTHLAEEQWLKEQLNVVKLCIFRVGTRLPTVFNQNRRRVQTMQLMMYFSVPRLSSNIILSTLYWDAFNLYFCL